MTQVEDFFWEGYVMPISQSKYSKIEKDKELRIRILGRPLVWYEYFDTDNQPHRQKERFDKLVKCQMNRFTWKEAGQKEFWAFKVFNINTWNVEIFQTDKVSIKTKIMDLIKDDDFWSPVNYDLKIKREWEGTDTEYKVMPWPISPLDESILEWVVNDTYVNLEALFIWKDPFDNSGIEDLEWDVQ